MKALEVGKKALSLEDVWDVAVEGRKVRLATSVEPRVKRSRAYVLGELKKGKTIYGLNTGFGQLANVKIDPRQLETLQVNLLRSHATGVGPNMPDDCVRGMLLLRAVNLSQGYSGVSLPVIKLLLSFLNKGIHPLVPQQGSVGASGDLAPLAHLALPLLGEGRVRYKGREMSGAAALKAAKLKPVSLGPKEGLALINGTQFMTSLGTLALLEAEYLADSADLCGAMTLEALRGTAAAFDPEIQRVRPHPGQAHVAKRLRSFLGKSEIAKSHVDCDRVQDPYSLRCMPQVHGASRDVMAFVRGVLEREINSVTDNPLVFPSKKKVVSGGNFHGQIVAMAMDALSIAVAELGSISEQRIEKLINPALSGLPAFLTPKGGLNSGFMIVQVAAASIVSENKTLCHPASVDSIPTSADKEDHVSMGAWAARKAYRVVTNMRRVLAMEMFAASQGIDLLRPLTSTKPLEAAHKRIRKLVRKVDEDRPFHEDLSKLEDMLREHQF